MSRAEDGSAGGPVVAMTAKAAGEAALRKTIRELHELVAALDRRVPQIERVGEADIARASAELRASAVRRIEELERTATGSTPAGAR